MTTTRLPADIHAGAKLRLQRRMLNMSQSDVGEALGITFQQVQKYENGTNRISASRLQMMCDFLGVTVDYFFAGESDRQTNVGGAKTDGVSDGGIKQFLTSKEGFKLNRAFVAIRDPVIRRSVLALIASLGEMYDAQWLQAGGGKVN